MDPLTQGVLGAALPQATTARHSATAGLIGFFAGMAPDLDVLIRSNSDPLLFLEYHRQFTHSLAFIPIGGLLCGVLLQALYGRRQGLSMRQSVVFATLGYGTHALLDGCTSYGTQLLWPFSDQRFAWNIISIIDPWFTLPILTLVIMCSWRRDARLAQFAIAWALFYPALGYWQQQRVLAVAHELAAQRQHTIQRLIAKPSFANILLWKTIYETDNAYYVDAVRVGWQHRIFPGSHTPKLDLARDFPWLHTESQQARDIERFRWFSDGYLARDPETPNRVVDIRYSMIPNQITPLWGIELEADAGSDQHVRYTTLNRPNHETWPTFQAMLLNTR